MNNSFHNARSRDSLYKDIEENLNDIYQLWINGNSTLRLSVTILCAVKLEAFINIAGELKIERWKTRERLSFSKKCELIFPKSSLTFYPNEEINKTAIELFNIRNDIVHPKMKCSKIYNEEISNEEYKKRSGPAKTWDKHHLKIELTNEKIIGLKKCSDDFVEKWGALLLEENPEYWLTNGAENEFSAAPIQD